MLSELPSDVQQQVELLYEDVRALQARTMLLEADNTELLEHISVIAPHAMYNAGLAMPEPASSVPVGSCGGAPAAQAQMPVIEQPQATSTSVTPPQVPFPTPLVNISFGAGQQEHAPQIVQASRANSSQAPGQVDQSGDWGMCGGWPLGGATTGQCQAGFPPRPGMGRTSSQASIEDALASAIPAALQSFLGSSIFGACQAQSQHYQQQQQQQQQQQVTELQQQVQSLQRQLQQLQEPPPQTSVQLADEVAGDIRSLVSELRGAGRALSEEMFSAVENFHVTQQSLLRQAAMPCMPPAATSLAPEVNSSAAFPAIAGIPQPSYWSEDRPAGPEIPLVPALQKSFEPSAKGMHMLQLPSVSTQVQEPLYGGRDVSSASMDFGFYSERSGKFAEEPSFSDVAGVTGASRWKSGLRGAGRRSGQPMQPLQTPQPSRPSIIARQMATLDARLDSLDSRFRHWQR